MFLLATPQLADTDVSSVRTLVYGASPISEDVLVKSMEAFGCDFAQVYGLTETTGAITSLMPDDHDPDGPRANLLRSAGRPFSHVELRIVDSATGEELPAGAVGEVMCRSDQTMLGYWNKAARDGRRPQRRRLVPDRRRRMAERGRLPLPARPDQGHDRVGRRERLPGRGGERPARPPAGGRRRGHRGARREVGRDGQGGGRASPRTPRTTPRPWPPTSWRPPGSGWPTSSARPRSTSSTSCPAIRRARC